MSLSFWSPFGICSFIVMEEKNRQNGIVQNRIPFERFVRLFAMIEIVLVFLYTKRFATFSVYGNRTWGLVIIVAVLALGSLVLSWKLERNWISLISGTLMPVLAYEAISMWRYSLAIRIMILAGCFVSVAVGLFWAVKKVNQTKRIRIRREVFVIKAARASRVICCLVLLGACVCGKILIASHYTISYSDIAYSMSESYNDISDYDNSLSANIATVAKIDPDGGWESLPLEEKIEVLETIIRIECRYLGMQDSAPALESWPTWKKVYLGSTIAKKMWLLFRITMLLIPKRVATPWHRFFVTSFITDTNTIR